MLRLVHGGSHAASPDTRSGRKSSAVTSPPVTSRMRAATSRPGQAGASEHRSVTYDGATPIASAKAERFIPAAASQSPSLLMEAEYSSQMKFSQHESFSGGLWPVDEVGAKMPGMAKVTDRHFIRAWRKFRGMTQAELADLVAMATSSISQLETGKQDYSQETLEKIAGALDCAPGDLLSVDPSRDESLWTIWESLSPAQRHQAVQLIRVLAETRTAA